MNKTRYFDRAAELVEQLARRVSSGFDYLLRKLPSRLVEQSDAYRELVKEQDREIERRVRMRLKVEGARMRKEAREEINTEAEERIKKAEGKVREERRQRQIMLGYLWPKAKERDERYAIKVMGLIEKIDPSFSKARVIFLDAKLRLLAYTSGFKSGYNISDEELERAGNSGVIKFIDKESRSSVEEFIRSGKEISHLVLYFSGVRYESDFEFSVLRGGRRMIVGTFVYLKKPDYSGKLGWITRVSGRKKKESDIVSRRVKDLIEVIRYRDKPMPPEN